MWPSRCHVTCRTANLSNDLVNSSFCYLVRLCSGPKDHFKHVSPCGFSLPAFWFVLLSGYFEESARRTILFYIPWWIFLEFLTNIPMPLPVIVCSCADNSEPGWVEVMVEILLSLLAQPSLLLRRISKNVFIGICPNLTKRGLQLILDVSEAQEGPFTVCLFCL